ncbi:AraC family transcriptional regulator [Kitasatospora sp. MMS16-BH015]|uniref:helix-turn-helix transcriptional regulator n=1 Tax=Kitasatospora sp. MMS16-BH015 TaxID=2018025 RepID=UPI000CA3D265|nr:AraC family transcriptional regulator [Kitasatospora sp. MMS16-BH015]AUG81729.1 AraC family transcriptional regulator [Kitasatospora sp. MMS16-BH015]
METLFFDSDSLEETEEFLSSAYTPMRIGGRPERSGARIERHAADGLLVDRLAFDYTMAYDAGQLNRVCLVSVHEGEFADTTRGEAELYGPGETFLVARPDRPYRGEVRQARYTLTMFDPGLLGEVAGVGGRADRPVELTGYRAIDAAANRQLGATVAYLRDHVLAEPGVADSPLAVATAARHLAAVTLATLPNSTLEVRAQPTDHRDATSDTLRRATAFIEANAHRDIGLAEIAAAVPVTPRAVQYAFARHAGTTPLAHLRQVRLVRAHQELLGADPARTTVTAVAARWGFTHPGRFSALYRRRYGLPPSTTLRG